MQSVPGGDVLDRIRFEPLRGTDPTHGCGKKAHCLRDGAVAKRNALPCVCVAWLLPVGVSIVLVRAACPETPCLQGPLLQAVAASARPGPTRLSQVWRGLPHRSLQLRLRTAPIDVRLRGGACALAFCAETLLARRRPYCRRVRPLSVRDILKRLRWTLSNLNEHIS